MKLDSLRRIARDKRLLTVVAIASVIILLAGFSIGQITQQPKQERPQQTNKLIIVNGTAHVTENSTVDRVNLIVRRGTRDVNLATTTIEWLGPNGARNLEFENGASKTASDTVNSGNSQHFKVVSIRDTDNSVPVVNDRTDRFQIIINTTAISGHRLAPSETVEIKLITSRRAVTRYTITIPELVGEETTVDV